MAREPSPPLRPRSRSPNQFARCPSPTFQRLQDELNRRDEESPKAGHVASLRARYSQQHVRMKSVSPNREVTHLEANYTQHNVRVRSVSPKGEVTTVEAKYERQEVRMRSISPKPPPPSKSRAASPSWPGYRAPSPRRSRACPSPTFQRLQDDLSPRPVSPSRDKVSMKVVQPERSASPIITITNHGVPPWAWAPRRRERRTPSPAAGLVAVQPAPRDATRPQSPSFNELERQMVEKNAYSMGAHHQRARSPTVQQFQRELAASPTVTLAQHGGRRSPSPSVRSRPTERRIVRLSSPVPFKKETSPYRHVAPPPASAPRHVIQHVTPPSAYGQRVCHVVCCDWILGRFPNYHQNYLIFNISCRNQQKMNQLLNYT